MRVSKWMIFGVAFGLSIGWAIAESRASDLLINYENDPDLAAAMEWDSECNGGDRTISSQQLAEKHYLAYLQRAKDADQIAFVYVQLGVLFNTNWHKEAGEKPDYAKARRYFTEALKVAPDRIGIPMIRARLGMVTPLQSAEERLEIRLEVYKWLESIDETSAKAHWFRSHPDEVPTDNDVRTMMGVLKNVRLSESDNILSGARAMKNPLQALQKVIDAFPGTELSEAANAKRQALLGKAAAPVVGSSKKEPGTKDPEPVGEIRAKDLEPVPVSEKAEVATENKSGAAPVVHTMEAHSSTLPLPVLWIAAVIGLGLVLAVGIGLVFYVRKTR